MFPALQAEQKNLVMEDHMPRYSQTKKMTTLFACVWTGRENFWFLKHFISKTIHHLETSKGIINSNEYLF